MYSTRYHPVDAGPVASLNRPGGNATGVSFLTTLLVAKRLELLHELTPAAASIGFLLNPTDPTIETQVKEAETAALTLGVRLVILKAGTPREIEAAFATIVAQRINSVLTSADAFFGIRGSTRDVVGPPCGARGLPHQIIRLSGWPHELRSRCF